MDFNTIQFSLSEEAFLLKSLNEVTKVWARASGKANFNLSVQDGQAHLQLGFQLGLPHNYHLPPPPRPSAQRYKGSVRRERDRLRAAEHQARLSASPTSTLKVAVPATPPLPASTSSNTPTRAAPATVKSPTTGSVVPSPCSTPSSTAVSASSTTKLIAAASVATALQ